jgi:quercetin dioxygenase-like cupin family protein
MSLHVPPYPPPRYTGESGEVSATLRRGDAPADYESYQVAAGRDRPARLRSGVKYSYLATQKSTDGDFTLFRVDLPPAAGGPGPHFHKAMSESFFVLSGTMCFYDGRDWIDGHQGDYLFVPPGGLHGFRNEADEPASILMLFAPGAPREAYFEGFANLADMTDDEPREWFIKHDNFFV